jgi:hypothetical protein
VRRKRKRYEERRGEREGSLTWSNENSRVQSLPFITVLTKTPRLVHFKVAEQRERKEERKEGRKAREREREREREKKLVTRSESEMKKKVGEKKTNRHWRSRTFHESS